MMSDKNRRSANGRFYNENISYNHSSVQFQEVVATFEHLTGLRVCIIFNPEYIKDSAYRDRTILERDGHRTDFCTLIKSSPKEKGCKQYDRMVRTGKAKKIQRPFIDECPSGVIELIIPFMVRGRFVATIFCGKIRKFPEEEKGFEYIWSKTSYRGVKKKKLHTAYQDFLYYPEDRLLQFGDFFFYALSFIANSMDDDAIERTIQLQKNKLIKEALSIIDNLNNTIPNEAEIAGYLGITSVYFSRLFKKVMGVKFIDYITEVRILRARELLVNTRLPIIDIAYTLGYEKQSYFSKKFHEIVGITPSKYRASSMAFNKIKTT